MKIKSLVSDEEATQIFSSKRKKIRQIREIHLKAYTAFVSKQNSEIIHIKQKWDVEQRPQSGSECQRCN